MMNMTHVEEVMTSAVITVDHSALTRDAQELARQRHIRHLVVLSDDRRPAGIVCVCDLEDSDPRTPVDLVMNTPIETIWARATVDQAAACMRHEHVGCLAVVTEGTVRGIVTRRDLRRAGLTQQATGGAECASCGAHHGIRPATEDLEVCFCAQCLDRALPAEQTDELGGGD